MPTPVASETAELPFVQVEQHGKRFYLTKMPVATLVRIAYASVRGVHKEEGAVQRILNVRRIGAIKEFTLEHGQYPASIVLNWVDNKNPIRIISDNVLSINVSAQAAQLIDGQHRVAGLRLAIEEQPRLRLEVPIALYEGLSTQECANIFLAINTEQKPVPRTLVFDLYGVADESIIDQAAARARDIVVALNEEDDSAYFEQIKMPGSPRRRGGIALSTAVTAIKPLVDEKGDFEQRNISDLETQKKVIKNWFSALRSLYGDAWEDSKNAFMYASGFAGAIDFLKTKLLAYGQTSNDYTKEHFEGAMKLDVDDLILQEEVKGIGGKDAPLMVLERLNNAFAPRIPENSNIRV